jgi:hypothetical protein
MKYPLMLRMVACWAALLTCGAVGAQVARDPTVAPPEVMAAPGPAQSDMPWGGAGVAVVVREGKPYLVSGTRLYAVGQAIGAFRIVRISETEVWLRSGKDLRKVPRFAGIQRKPSATPGGSNP